MNKFVYFSPYVIKAVDWNLDWVPKKNRHWVESTSWNSLHHGHIISRVHDISPPWKLCGTVCEMPKNLSILDENFSDVMDRIAIETIEKIKKTSQTPYIFYSGGIDSTSIFVALLKNADKDFLKSLIVVCNEDSIHENPYFFDKFIKNKFMIIDTDRFALDQSNYNQIAIFDGEAGNQCLSAGGIYDLARKKQTSLLNQHYSIIEKFEYVDNDRFFVNLALESLKYAPIPIKHLYDFFWWANFNFKFDHVLLRKILVYTDNLTGGQRKSFFYNNLYRFYAHPDMQKWCMSNLTQLRNTLDQTTKYHAKKYIFDYDKNEYYFLQKRESASVANVFAIKDIHGITRIGLDEQWNIVDFSHRDVRQMIKKLIIEN